VALEQSLNSVEIREKLASKSESVLGLPFICLICFWLRNGMLKTISAFVSPGRRVQNGINQTLRLSALIRRMKSQVFRFFG
jgi:hypothetical protein